MDEMDRELYKVVVPRSLLWLRFLASTSVLLLVVVIVRICEINGLSRWFTGMASTGLLAMVAIYSWFAALPFIHTTFVYFMRLVSGRALWMVPFCLASSAITAFDMTMKTRVLIAAGLCVFVVGSTMSAIVNEHVPEASPDIQSNVALHITMISAGCAAIISPVFLSLFAIPFMVIVTIVGNHRMRRMSKEA